MNLLLIPLRKQLQSENNFLTQTGRYYYHLTDIQTESQVKEIAGKRNVSTPKRGTNSLIQLNILNALKTENTKTVGVTSRTN